MKLLKFYEMAGKRGKKTNLSIRIDDRTFFNKTTAVSFREAINYIVKKVGGDLFKKEINSVITNTTFPKSSRNSIILSSPDSFPDYVSKSQITPIDETDLYLSSHLSNQEKKNILESIFKHFKIDGSIEVIKQEVEESESDDSTEDDLIDDEDELSQEYTDETDTDQFDNKGKYSIDELKEKLEQTFLNNHRISTFIKILLSKNKKFDREEIKEELHRNGYGKTVGSAGYVLAGISNFVSNLANDHVRQILEYDLARWSPESVGGMRNNYKIVDEYRDLVSEILNDFNYSQPEKVENQPVSNINVKFWLYAPGDSSKKWDEFYNAGIMGLGWDDLGDFDDLGSRDEITTKLRSLYPDGSSQTNSSLAIYEFRDVIKPGDVIIVKQGTSAYLGYGIVVSDNYFDNDADELKNRREVDWKKKGLFPAGRTIVQKTLTDITKYPTYVKSLIDLIGIEEFMDEDDYSDLEDIKPFSKFPQPFDVESELKRAQAQSEDDLKSYSFPFKSDKEVMSFIDFKAMEPNEKFGENPFSQAICVLGESGAGKSTTVDNILQKSGHIYQYIIPSASTTGLLSQFSPSAGSAGGYIPSRLGQMIEMAYNNKNKLYTAVFDECHKTSIIEMINDELLQAISKNRNKGVRFISLDDDTRRLFPSAQEDSRGNVLIPDNFGFIFISSNARVIAGNPDFFNRVDLIELTEEDRKMKTIEELNQKRVTDTDDKKQLVNKIVSGGQ